MNSINKLIAKVKLFFLLYKQFFPTIVIIIIFIPIFFYSLSLHKKVSSPLAKQENIIKTSLSPSKNSVLSPTAPQYTLAQEENEIASGNYKFVEHSKGDKVINTISLSDGKSEYEYSSDDPKRPDMQIVKNNIIIFKRSRTSNATISDYSEFLTNPPYATEGSSYYGSTAVILANPTLGIAAVYNPESNQVYEQYLFQKMSVNDYVQKFGKDISSFNPEP